MDSLVDGVVYYFGRHEGVYFILMKAILIKFSKDYQMTLDKHLKAGSRASLKPATALGREAAALGLDTLDMVRIHEKALLEFEPSAMRGKKISQSEGFFMETISPIEQTHSAAQVLQDKISRTEEELAKRTKKLAFSILSIKKGEDRQKLIQAKLKKNQSSQAGQLKQSISLQKNLRQMTHKLITAEDSKRKELGQKIHNEISQNLIGIYIYLLVLKKEALRNGKSLKKEIANAQLLVNHTSRSI